MNLYEQSELISEYIRECNDIIHESGHEIACEYGLTYDQYHILLILINSREELSIRDISDIFNRAPNTISEKITRLEEKKLITRRKDKNDKRICRVIATRDATSLIELIQEEKTKRITYKALEKLDESDVENILKSLSKLKTKIQEEAKKC